MRARPIRWRGGVRGSARLPAGGCLMSVDVTNDVSVPGFFPVGFAAHLPEDGGTSGIIVDNVSTEAQASSIYFTPLGCTRWGQEVLGRVRLAVAR